MERKERQKEGALRAASMGSVGRRAACVGMGVVMDGPGRAPKPGLGLSFSGLGLQILRPGPFSRLGLGSGLARLKPGPCLE